MKKRMIAAPRRSATVNGLVAGLALAGSTLPLVAQEKPDAKPAKAPELSESSTNELVNSITLGVGSTFIDGDKAAAQQRSGLPKGPFGGIEEFHYEQNVGKKGTFEIDGHGIFDNHDYDVRLKLSEPDKGYISAGYNEFRTYYDGNAGFFPPNSKFISIYDNDLHVDRGQAWVEAGLRLPDVPELTFRYSHEFRSGMKDSTEWGDSNLTGGLGTRNIVPTFLSLDEKRDSFEGDAKHTIGNTDIGLGVRYEIIDNLDSRDIQRRPGESVDRDVVQTDGLKENMFNVHAFTESRLKDNLTLTLGGSATSLDTDISGSRIYGSSYDPIYDPTFARRQTRDEGFVGLSGGAQMKQYVGNLNLMYSPWEYLTVVPSLRVEKETLHGVANFLDTSVGSAPALATSQVFTSNSSEDGYTEVSQSLEARYTGFKNWSIYTRGEWSETDGNQMEDELAVLTNTLGLFRDTDWNRFDQKYTIGANWYPLSRLNFGAQYYHKDHNYDYSSSQDSTSNLPTSGDRYPAYLTDQSFRTDDMNIRATWRPCGTLTSITRYDFQLSTIDTQGQYLSDQQSAKIHSHIISESLSWTPLSRLYVQASASYALDGTDTPASTQLGATNLVLNAKNNYWNASCAVGYALNEKTDFQAQYFYYRANDYVNNAAFGMPYGADAEESGITATISRQISRAVRMSLKYGFFRNRDGTSGGFNNYDAHLVYSSLQYRF